jgi:hypothetical protein
MKGIPFLQYLRPSGRPNMGFFDRSEQIEQLAQSIIDLGYRFTAEMLTTGEISLAVEGPDGDIACRIAPNGPAVLAAVDDLVRAAATMLKIQIYSTPDQEAHDERHANDSRKQGT